MCARRAKEPKFRLRREQGQKKKYARIRIKVEKETKGEMKIRAKILNEQLKDVADLETGYTKMHEKLRNSKQALDHINHEPEIVQKLSETTSGRNLSVRGTAKPHAMAGSREWGCKAQSSESASNSGRTVTRSY